MKSELEKLKALNEDDVLQKLEYEKCKRDPWYWLTHWVWTLDEHEREGDPVKKFPDKEYLHNLVELWEERDRLLVLKSRQMMATWIFVALFLHDTQFNVGRLNFFVTKKEDDANSLVERAEFIYNQQPEFFRKHEAKKSYCKLHFEDIHSMIWGVPQGADQLRMYTASGILSDEMAFQPEAEDAYMAAKPTIEGGGKFVGVSTAYPSFFEELFKDQVGVYGLEETG